MNHLLDQRSEYDKNVHVYVWKNVSCSNNNNHLQLLLLPDIPLSSFLSGFCICYLMLSKETGLSSQLHSGCFFPAAVDSTGHGLPLLVVNCDCCFIYVIKFYCASPRGLRNVNVNQTWSLQ